MWFGAGVRWLVCLGSSCVGLLVSLRSFHSWIRRRIARHLLLMLLAHSHRLSPSSLPTSSQLVLSSSLQIHYRRPGASVIASTSTNHQQYSSTHHNLSDLLAPPSLLIVVLRV
ncbi:hypothetical protein BD310DRAFT_931757 [Dichomitus squalens]|uniref:Uncharacterized protein n=1 Tax=Dichomitus squalens TaxID=114155 RepID=A0A4Q9PPX3_9APHY|nr:hypothetical protein BD310DRAFT_931757 [Dichomitus squalens]